MSELLPAVPEVADLAEAISADDDPWLIIDDDSTFGRTRYLCRACLADLTDLHVHHVYRFRGIV